MISSLHNNISPPENGDERSSEDGVWLSMWRGGGGGGIKQNRTKKHNHTRNSLTLWKAFVNVLHINYVYRQPGGTQSVVLLRNATTNS